MLKRRISVLFACLVIMSQCMMTVHASADISVISAYYMEQSAYTFLSVTGDAAPENLSVALVHDGNMEGKEKVTALTGEDATVYYMFLVDASTSMKWTQKSRVQACISSLLEAEQQEYSVSIATFGTEFDVVAEGMQDYETVKESISELKFDQQGTEISEGLSNALLYLSTMDREEGALVNLVLFTDGIPWLSDGDDSEEIQAAAEVLAKVIENNKSVVLHTVSMGEWEQATYEAVSSGTGLDLSVNSNSEAQQAGIEIAEFADSLYVTDCSFSLGADQDSTEVQLYITYSDTSAREIIEVGTVNNLNVKPVNYIGSSPDNPLSPDDPAETDPENPEGSDNPDNPDDPAETDPEGSDDPDNPDDPAEKDPDNPEGSDDPDDPDNLDDSTDPDNLDNPDELEIVIQEDEDEGLLSTLRKHLPPVIANHLLIFLIAIAAVILIVIAVIILLCVRHKKKKPTDPQPLQDGIPLSFEVLSGQCKNQDRKLVLRDQLLIGSGPDCDIICDAPSVSAQNSRIFISDELIWIEDLNERSNTYVGGTRIYAPNRLRSEDEITVGDVRFKVYF